MPISVRFICGVQTEQPPGQMVQVHAVSGPEGNPQPLGYLAGQIFLMRSRSWSE